VNVPKRSGWFYRREPPGVILDNTLSKRLAIKLAYADTVGTTVASVDAVGGPSGGLIPRKTFEPGADVRAFGWDVSTARNTQVIRGLEPGAFYVMHVENLTGAGVANTNPVLVPPPTVISDPAAFEFEIAGASKAGVVHTFNALWSAVVSYSYHIAFVASSEALVLVTRFNRQYLATGQPIGFRQRILAYASMWSADQLRRSLFPSGTPPTFVFRGDAMLVSPVQGDDFEVV
jgi:hypothetical protein